jgi:hypothetical protein
VSDSLHHWRWGSFFEKLFLSTLQIVFCRRMKAIPLFILCSFCEVEHTSQIIWHPWILSGGVRALIAFYKFYHFYLPHARARVDSYSLSQKKIIKPEHKLSVNAPRTNVYVAHNLRVCVCVQTCHKLFLRTREARAQKTLSYFTFRKIWKGSVNADMRKVS